MDNLELLGAIVKYVENNKKLVLFDPDYPNERFNAVSEGGILHCVELLKDDIAVESEWESQLMMLRGRIADDWEKKLRICPQCGEKSVENRNPNPPDMISRHCLNKNCNWKDDE